MVKHRNPFIVFLLGIFTLGIYQSYWLVSTSRELRGLGVEAPDGHDLLLVLLLLPAGLTPLGVVGAILGAKGMSAGVWELVFPFLLFLALLWLIVCFVVTVSYYMSYGDAVGKVSNCLDLWVIFIVFAPLAMALAQRYLNEWARYTPHLDLLH